MSKQEMIKEAHRLLDNIERIIHFIVDDLNKKNGG